MRLMKSLGLAVVALTLLLLTSSVAKAQTATSGDKFGFDEVGQTLTVANGASYKLYLDGSTTGVTGLSLACTVVSNLVSCSVSIPALTVGAHTVTISQVINTAESAKSSPLSFTFVVVVTPTNLRIVMMMEDFLRLSSFSLVG